MGEKKGTGSLASDLIRFRSNLADSNQTDLAMLNHESPGKRVSPRRNMLSRRDAHHSAFASLRSLGLPSSITPSKRNGKPLLPISMKQILRRTPTYPGQSLVSLLF